MRRVDLPTRAKPAKSSSSYPQSYKALGSASWPGATGFDFASGLWAQGLVVVSPELTIEVKGSLSSISTVSRRISKMDESRLRSTPNSGGSAVVLSAF